jgi:hypothetical protein
MQAHYEEVKENSEKQQNMLNNSKSKSIARPNIANPPNYTVKAPRK